MTSVVSIEGFVPSPRFNGTPWTQARIEYAETTDGSESGLETSTLSPVDTDPTEPASRSFTTVLAPSDTGYFRVVWIDADGFEQASGWVYVSPATYRARGETVAELLEQAMEEFGFDASEAAGLRWFNNRHRKMIAEARWLRVSLPLGETVVGQERYSIDPDVVELYELQVGGLGYRKARRADLIAGRLNRLSLSGLGGVFIPDADEAGAESLVIYPAPTTAGDTITAFAAVLPPDLSLSDRPMVPPDFNDALVEGMIATGLSRDTEQINAADRFEARFNAEVERLRVLSRRRFRGPGPAQIRVQGINA